MLLLVFKIADDAYAVDAEKVVEVVPRVNLRAVPHAPEYLAGLFHYRDTMAPVIDMNQLIDGHPCRDRLSTRIILVQSPVAGGAPFLLGLMAERVDDLKSVSGKRAMFPAMPLSGAPYLGPIIQADETLVQLIDVEQVLPEALREALFGALEAS
ncbi:chemotaxis protein CheW [Singulisphaera rosea]